MCSPVHKAAVGLVDPDKGISIRCAALRCAALRMPCMLRCGPRRLDTPAHCPAQPQRPPRPLARPRSFPRLVRVRDDKGPEDATSAEQVAEMYQRQAVLQQKVKGTAAAAGDDDE